jgi:hypothetical protein
MNTPKEQSDWSQLWIGLVAALTAVAIVIATRAGLLPVEGWLWPFGGAAGAFFAAMAGAMRYNEWRPAVAWGMWPLADGWWIVFAVYCGWNARIVMALLVGTALLVFVGHLLHPVEQLHSLMPEPTVSAVAPLAAVDRISHEATWEALIQQVSKQPIRVTRVEPWDVPANGERVHVDLPVGLVWTELTNYCAALQGSRKLPRGCVIRVLEGEHQGAAIFDVMLRDSLADAPPPEPKDFSPVSINHMTKVMRTPRNEPLEVSFREPSVVIGGTAGAGKTTLLHRIILWLARCVDALIWVIDMNGGGLGAPWVTAWAQGRAGRPVVDWIADNEAEAAVMTAVLIAISKDRKTDPEGIRRKRAANTTVLPVDAKKSAIIAITDEGGEVRQAVGLLGQLVSQRISRTVQIGRAEAVRVVMSILRGTSDLLDKNLRTNAPIRICLRMEEEDEYGHVLGVNPPGRVELLHKGTGYIRRGGVDPKPVFAVTADFTLAEIDEAAIATAHLRPELDDRAQLVASQVTVNDVLEGKAVAIIEDDPQAMAVMRDVAAGAAYSRRWERYAPELAKLRGDDLPEMPITPPTTPPAAAPTSSAPAQPAPGAVTGTGSVLDELLAETDPARKPEPRPAHVATRSVVDVGDQAAVDTAARALLAGLEEVKLTARDVVLQILNERPEQMLTSAEIGMELERRGAAVSRTHRQEVLKELREEGLLLHANGKYQSRQAAA